MQGSKKQLLVALTAGIHSGVMGANPFASGNLYVNPDYQVELETSINTLPDGSSTRTNLQSMMDVSTGFWVDKMSKIHSNNNTVTDTVEEILIDAASQSTPPLVVFVVYDAPNRDCAAVASYGEICCNYNADGSCAYTNKGDCADGLAEYDTDYLEPFAQLLSQYGSKVPVALVIEPDTLPNLATNLDPDTYPSCADVATQASYKSAVSAAVNKFKDACPSCTIYLDAAHGGWLGWPSNMEAYVNIVKGLNVTDSIQGFTTNSANYQPLGTLCSSTCTNYLPLPAAAPVVPRGQRPDTAVVAAALADHGPLGSSTDPCCDDPCGLMAEGNPANNELNYASQLRTTVQTMIAGFNPTFIIDTGRNGVSNMRADCSNWCNIRNAGTGTKPTSATNSGGLVDAFLWLKPPGESDGCTELLPDPDDPDGTNGTPCPRYDPQCASKDSVGSQPGEPYAPEAGNWFDYTVKQLADNAVWA